MESISKSQTKRILADELPKLIGLTIEEATALLSKKEYSFRIRIMEEDDISYVGTLEFRPNRINVAIKNNVITEVLSIG